MMNSKADPIFRGSKPARPPDAKPRVWHFQSRPDLQGVKTEPPRGQGLTQCTSKADPIFRGSKHGCRRKAGCIKLPKQTRSSGGQNSRALQRLPYVRLPKQTRSSGGQNPPDRDDAPRIVASKADPIFRGSKPLPLLNIQAARPWLPKQTRSSGGQNRSARLGSRISSLPKQTRSSGGQNHFRCAAT